MLKSEQIKSSTSLSVELCTFCYKSAVTRSTYHVNNVGSKNEEVESDKQSKSDEHTDSNDLLNNFIKYLGRFIGQEIERDECNKLLSCCRDCGTIISAFCRLFHELKCLELQLEWRLGTLVNIMRFANRVPSRLRQLKTSFKIYGSGESEVQDNKQEERRLRLKTFQKYRNNLMKKCSHRLSKSLPRVSIKSWKKATIDQDEASQAAATLSPNPTLEPECNSTGFPEGEKELELLEMSKILAGWILSYSAVAALLLTPKIEVIKKEVIPFPDGTFQSVPSIPTVGASLVLEDRKHDSLVKVECGDSGTINDNFDVIEFSSGVETKMPGIKVEPQLSTEFEESEQVFVKVDQSSHDQEFHGNQEELESFPENISINEDDDFSFDEMDTMEYTVCDSEGVEISPGLTNLPLPERELNEDNETESRPLIEKIELVETPIPPPPPIIVSLENQHHNELMAPTAQQQQRYSLRENRKSLYSEIEVGIGEDDDLSDHTYYHPDENEEESSSMESDDESFLEPAPKKRGRPRKRVISSSEKISNSMTDMETTARSSTSVINQLQNCEYLFCNLDGCAFKLRGNNLINRHQFQEHQKLHAPGSYKCNYCEVTEESMIKLIAHESNVHPSETRQKNPNEDAKDEAPTNVSRRNHYCPRCPFESESVNEYQKHFVETHCNAKKADTSKFEPVPSTSHQSKSFESSEFACPISDCPHKFNTKLAQAKHYKLHRKCLCKFCGVVLKYAPDLPLHETSKHVIIRASSKNSSLANVFHCSRCPSHFAKKTEYLRHFFKTHLHKKSGSNTTPSVSAQTPATPETATTAQDTIPPIRIITCHVCKTRGNSASFLKSHFLSHHNTEGLDPSKIWKCPQCPAYFIKVDQLTEHQIKTQHFDDEKCNEINPRTDSSVRTEPPIIQDILEAVCHLCGEMYATQEEMDKHFTIIHADTNGKKDVLALNIL